MRFIKPFFSWGVLIGGVVLGAIALSLVLAGLILLRPAPKTASIPTPHLTVVPAPTLTLPAAAATSPAMMPATATPPIPPAPVSNGSIGIGIYVQIAGTGGEGLRLRSAPGKDSPPRFLGMEAEAFLVTDGPKDKDGITWWYLVAPYDKNRAGWAAANYLVVVQKATESQ
jgi:hypothetical protein